MRHRRQYDSVIQCGIITYFCLFVTWREVKSGCGYALLPHLKMDTYTYDDVFVGGVWWGKRTRPQKKGLPRRDPLLSEGVQDPPSIKTAIHREGVPLPRLRPFRLLYNDSHIYNPQLYDQKEDSHETPRENRVGDGFLCKWKLQQTPAGDGGQVTNGGTVWAAVRRGPLAKPTSAQFEASALARVNLQLLLMRQQPRGDRKPTGNPAVVTHPEDVGLGNGPPVDQGLL